MGADNLRSTDTLEVLLGISEGVIVGLENGPKSFYLGGTALQNADGHFNFANYFLKEFPGADPADPVVMRLGGTSNNTAVGTDLSTGIAVTRTTGSGAIDYIDFRILVQRLIQTTSSGTKGSTVEFSIETKPTSGSTWTKVTGANITITGQTSSTYVKEFRVAVPRLTGGDTYDLRVTKITEANTDKIFSDIQWESFQEITSTQVAHDNTALVQFSVRASQQLSSLPTFSGIYLGRLLKLPSNYNPTTRVYTGAWDGSWQVAWSDNPAWVLYDFVMDERFGIKSYYLDVNLDKYDVYDVGKWCDEPVSDGTVSGTQPRYTFNAYISDPRPGKELARFIAGAFNSTFFDDLNGTAFLRADRDDDAVIVLAKENVIDGIFDYSYTDITSRYNDITAAFINPNTDWNDDFVRVKNDALIALYGRIPLDFVAVGSTNRHETLRRAQYKLITATTEVRMVNFQMNRLGSFLKPFDVILICDPDMGWGISGRIRSLATDRLSVVVRDPVFLEVGVTYAIKLALKDGTYFTSNLVTGSPSGLQTTLVFEDAVPAGMIAEKATFSLECDGVIGLPRPFRVMKCDEVDGSPDRYAIQAISINRNKYTDADNVTESGEIVYSVLPSPVNPPGPTSVKFTERWLSDLNVFELTIDPLFDRTAYKYYKINDYFEVWTRATNSDDPFTRQDLKNSFLLLNHPPGDYDFKIKGLSTLGYATDLDQCDTYIYTCSDSLNRLTISGSPTLTGTAATPYTDFTPTITGGLEQFVFSLYSGTLPAGMTLDSSTGILSGTPTTPGTYADIGIRVTDDHLITSDLALFTLTIS